jgi:predicted ATPase
MPATLHALGREAEQDHKGGALDLNTRVANRLSELVENVRELHIDVDEKRQLLSIVVADRYDTSHVASALSDGTLRFLALTVMEADPHGRTLICLEEPENGMHPQRIPAMIELLGDIAVDSELPVDAENPLRQVIINTHSPVVVACVDDGALLAAQEIRTRNDDGGDSHLALRHLVGTWRSKAAPRQPAIRGAELVTYLDPLALLQPGRRGPRGRVGAAKRVIDRDDLQLPLRLVGESFG